MAIRKFSRALCCGNICLDIPVTPVDHLSWGTTTWVETISQSIGGNGANTSFTLARLSVPVRLFGRASVDSQGVWLKTQLAAAGVDVSGVHDSQSATTCTVVLVNSTGDRLFLHRVGSSSDVSSADIEWPNDGNGVHFHLANLFALPNLRNEAAAVLKQARDLGCTTSLDTGWDARGLWMEHVGPCLPFTDLLFVNESESKMLSGIDEPRQAAERLQQLGATCVITKLGPQGCLISSSGDHQDIAGFPVESVDTTGCGDCFAGGFLAALHYGASYPIAARFANAVGALNVQKLGAVGGIRDLDGTLAWLRERCPAFTFSR